MRHPQQQGGASNRGGWPQVAPAGSNYDAGRSATAKALREQLAATYLQVRLRSGPYSEGMREHDDITNAIEQHSDTVLRVCSLYFHGKPEREDAFQETFLKYAQSDKAFTDEEHVKAWLINVAANTCKDMLKRSDAKAVLLGEFEDTARQSWQHAESPSRFDELNEALQRLDASYRIALYLKYYEGYTAAEIARLLNIPENTVYTNLARGRKELKEVLTRGKREHEARRAG